jgi:hypothetical protein
VKTKLVKILFFPFPSWRDKSPSRFHLYYPHLHQQACQRSLSSVPENTPAASFSQKGASKRRTQARRTQLFAKLGKKACCFPLYNFSLPFLFLFFFVAGIENVLVSEFLTVSNVIAPLSLLPGGIVTKAIELVPSSPVTSPRTRSSTGEPKAIYHIYIVIVDSLASAWPEQDQRERRTLPLDEALEIAGWREEIGIAREDIRQTVLRMADTLETKPATSA